MGALLDSSGTVTITLGEGPMSFSAEKVSIDVWVWPTEKWNVYPNAEGPSIPNTGITIEVWYKFRNTGSRAEFCYECQTISDEPGMAPGDKIRTPWNVVEAGAEFTHKHWLVFGLFGAQVKNWIYARPVGGGAETLVIPEYDFRVDTYSPEAGTKQFTRIYTWPKDVYLYGSAEDDLEIYWAGTLDFALLEFDINTFIVGSSFKCHLNDQTIIEGTQYDSAKFSKDIKSILRNGLNHILVEVSYLSMAHWTVNVKITIKYSCTQAEQDQLDQEHPAPKPQCPSGQHWNSWLNMCVPDWFEIAVVATGGIAALYLLTRRSK
jgi:hypothetical protein